MATTVKPSHFHRQDYSFELPPKRIAQKPRGRRGASKLLVGKGLTETYHQGFSDLPLHLAAGDLLVLNQTKVMNARCFAHKDNGVRIEIFILNIQVDPSEVAVLFKPAKRVKPGMVLTFPVTGLSVRVVTREEGGRGRLDFQAIENLHRVLEQEGQIPLPPYIKRDQGPDEEDRERYQTVFAKELGAVAAPTAGLHFTDALLERLRTKDIAVCAVTHHVGIGTFKPMVVDDIRDHHMDTETYTIGPDAAEALNRAKRERRRIIAVGTTSTRCLESNYRDGFHAGSFETGLYIYPGYRFNAIDGLITNFHLPGSSLMLLVCALMGRERMMGLYREAIARDYLFYSYGDAMFILPDR